MSISKDISILPESDTGKSKSLDVTCIEVDVNNNKD